MTSDPSPSAPRSEVDRFWDGAGRYAATLSIGAIPAAFVRVWGHFTLEGFLANLILMLLVMALLFPIFWVIKNVFSPTKPKTDT